MDFELLKNAKESYESFVETANVLERNGWISIGDRDLTISTVLEIELIRYIEYLIAADGKIDRNEVDVFKFITGYGGETLDSLKENIENSDVMSYDFQSTPPLGLRLLIEGTNEFVIQNSDKEDVLAGILAKYLFVHYVVGHCVIAADDTVTFNEKRNFKAYLDTMMQFIKMKSYLANNYEINRIKRDLIEQSDL